MGDHSFVLKRKKNYLKLRALSRPTRQPASHSQPVRETYEIVELIYETVFIDTNLRVVAISTAVQCRPRV